jgi:SAM-dependent methyltransferase
MNAPNSTNGELGRWNQRFASADYIFGTTPNAFLASQAHLLKPGQRALCVADGEGRNSVWLAEQGLDVVAFDISPVGVDKARRLAADHSVTIAYEIADIESWSWPKASFDIVAAIFVQFADPAMRAALFEHMAAALRPGGYLIMQGYTPKQIEYKTGGPPHAENMYTPELLRASFAHLEIVTLREYEQLLTEGTQHSGRSALIDFVGRVPK